MEEDGAPKVRRRLLVLAALEELTALGEAVGSVDIGYCGVCGRLSLYDAWCVGRKRCERK